MRAIEQHRVSLSDFRRDGRLTPDYYNCVLRSGDPLVTSLYAAFDRLAPAVCAPDREALGGSDLVSHIREISAALGETPSLIAIVLPDGPELLSVILGSMLQGVAAPVSPDLPLPEMRNELTALRPDTIVFSGEASNDFRSLLDTLGVHAVEAYWTRGNPAGVVQLRKALAPINTNTRSLPPGTRLLLKTSSTSGRAKRVPLSALNIAASIENQKRCFELSTRDRLLAFGPLWHLHALGSAFAQLSAGGSVVCTSGFDPVAFPQWLRNAEPTWYTGPPTVHRAIASLLHSGVPITPNKLRFVRSSSAPLESALHHEIESALNVPLLNSYGMTEAGTIAACPLPPAPRKQGSSGIGAGAEIAFFDGEIGVRGPNVVGSYLDNPAADAETFRDGWMLTGDLGYVDPDGYLFITGRRTEVINRGGHKIMPAEVEAAVLLHGDVADAAAFGIPHGRLGQDVAVAVVLQNGARISDRELRAHTAGQLAAFKVPRRIFFTATIPRTSTGKPHRPQLMELAHEPPRAKPKPLTPNEQRIAAICSRVIGCADISAEEELWDLGADSLSAAIILAEVQAAFSIGASFSGFFGNPTIANLASMVETAGATPQGIIHLHGAGSLAPVFCVPATSADPYYLRHLASAMHPERPVYAAVPPTHSEPTVEDLAAGLAASIREMRSQGPLFVAGHCFGGVLAFETACRLRDAGMDVRALILFDTPTPGYPKPLPKWRRYPGAAWALLHERGAGALLREIPKHLSFLAQNRKRTAPEAPVIRRTLHSYQPRTFDRPIAQAIALSHRASARVLQDERLGWRDFAHAGFFVLHVQGDHDSILLPPAVVELAAKLEPIFESEKSASP